MKLFISIIISTTLALADMKSFLDSTITTMNEQPGYYEGQTRNLYTLGSSRIRFKNQGTIQPIHLQAPRLSIGCGGIDMVMGGFSYLSVDQIIEKFKAITASAPAFAFKMALSELCEECDSIMTELENIADLMNNMNFSACQASQKIGAYVGEAFNQNLMSGQSDGYINQRAGGVANALKGWRQSLGGFMGDASKGNDAVNEITLMGSMIEKALSKDTTLDLSFLGNDDSGGLLFVSLIRAMVGDVIGYYDNKDESPKLIIIPPNPNFDYDKFLDGGDQVPYIYIKDNAEYKGMPTMTLNKTIQFDGMQKIMQDRLGSIMSKMKARQKIDSNDRKFIQSMPIPIYSYLNLEVLSQGSNTEILSEYLSIIETKAFFKFIIITTSKALQSSIANRSKDHNPDEVKQMLESIAKNSIYITNELDQWYMAKSKDFEKSKSINSYYIDLNKRLKSKLINNNLYGSFIWSSGL
jgi:conjugative transfer pilus assembly protein TraH